MSIINTTEVVKTILCNSTISVSSDHAFITCYHQKDRDFLIQNRKNIRQALSFILKEDIFSIHWVTILIKGDEAKTCFTIEKSQECIMDKIIIPSEFNNLIQECLSYKDSCGIVRMSDHKGLFSNERIMYSSSAKPNDWLGKKMSDYWYADELETYLSRLVKESELRNYSYVAKLFDGRSIKMTVDARLIEWHGEPCRIVKTIERQVLV